MLMKQDVIFMDKKKKYFLLMFILFSYFTQKTIKKSGVAFHKTFSQPALRRKKIFIIALFSRLNFYFLLLLSRESIVFDSNFRSGDFDGFTRNEVPWIIWPWKLTLLVHHISVKLAELIRTYLDFTSPWIKSTLMLFNSNHIIVLLV